MNTSILYTFHNQAIHRRSIATEGENVRLVTAITNEAWDTA
jgi:hypothetical protein